MNWGKKIALGYLSFVALMVFMVYMCIQQKDIFLVTEDYYQKELVYEDVIVKKQNAAKLSSEVEINYAENGIKLDFPAESKGSTGTVTFYRPSDTKLDQSMPLVLGNGTSQLIPTNGMQKGLYVLKIDWQTNKKGYYLEQKITI